MNPLRWWRRRRDRDGRSVRMEIEWVSAGHVAQDQALADDIADFAMTLLDGFDPWVGLTLTRPLFDRRGYVSGDTDATELPHPPTSRADPVVPERGGYSGTKPGAEMGPPRRVPSGAPTASCGMGALTDECRSCGVNAHRYGTTDPHHKFAYVACVNTLKSLVENIADSGVELDNAALDYVVVQINRSDWEACWRVRNLNR